MDLETLNIWSICIKIDGFPGSSTGERICLQCRRPQFNSLFKKNPWRKDRVPTPGFLGYPGGSDGKESTYNVGDLGSIPGLRRCPGGGHGNPLQYSCMENTLDREAWWAMTHGIARVRHDWVTKHITHTSGKFKAYNAESVNFQEIIWQKVILKFYNTFYCF